MRIFGNALYAAHRVAANNKENHERHAEHHYDTLNKIGSHLCHVSAENEKQGGNHGYYYHTGHFGNVKHHLAYACKPFVNRGRIGNEEYKHNDRRKSSHGLGIVSQLKKLRHRFYFKPIGNVSCSAGKQLPCEVGTEHGVAESRKHAVKPEAPARCAGIAHKHDGRKICCAVAQRRKPRACVSPADCEVGGAGYLF